MDSTPNSNAHVANDKELQSTLTTKIPPQNTITVNRNQSHFLGPVEKKPIGFLDLPFEIRSMIYNLCFVRSSGIVPCFTFQKSCTLHDQPYRGFKWVKSPHNRYRFEGNEQFFVGTECTLVHCSLYTVCIYRVLIPRELRNQSRQPPLFCNILLSCLRDLNQPFLGWLCPPRLYPVAHSSDPRGIPYIR
jgi:hypothetical protein